MQRWNIFIFYSILMIFFKIWSLSMRVFSRMARMFPSLTVFQLKGIKGGGGTGGWPYLTRYLISPYRSVLFNGYLLIVMSMLQTLFMFNIIFNQFSLTAACTRIGTWQDWVISYIVVWKILFFNWFWWIFFQKILYENCNKSYSNLFGSIYQFI